MKINALSLFVLAFVIVASGFTQSTASYQKSEVIPYLQYKQLQTVNLFVSHGHCSLPFSGIVENLKVIPTLREDKGNPLESMKISFEIDPNSFNVCAGDDLTAMIKTPGLFIGENDENITFTSTNVYTMGLEWYQVNGTMSIKGVARDVKLFVTGIKDANDVMPSSLVLQGQMNLFDWGIDYDKIVNGSSDRISTKWMYINMTISMS